MTGNQAMVSGSCGQRWRLWSQCKNSKKQQTVICVPVGSGALCCMQSRTRSVTWKKITISFQALERKMLQSCSLLQGWAQQVCWCFTNSKCNTSQVQTYLKTHPGNENRYILPTNTKFLKVWIFQNLLKINEYFSRTTIVNVHLKNIQGYPV